MSNVVIVGAARTAIGTARKGSLANTPAEKMAEDLVAVATGGGIAAAVTVAAEHDPEDAAAAGDVEEPEAEVEPEQEAEPEAEAEIAALSKRISAL